MLWAGVALAAVVIAVRLIWMWSVPRLVARIGHMRRIDPTGWREQTVLGWAGMRGVVSLALALALPMTLQAGEVRHTIIFMTFVVIFATLLVQGATLVPLVHWLRVGDPELEARDEANARSRARRAGLKAIRNALGDAGVSQERGRQLTERVSDGSIGIASAGDSAGRPGDRAPLVAALQAQRRSIDRLRDGGHLGESLAERLETELDLDEMGARGDGARLTGAGQD